MLDPQIYHYKNNGDGFIAGHIRLPANDASFTTQILGNRPHDDEILRRVYRKTDAAFVRVVPSGNLKVYLPVKRVSLQMKQSATAVRGPAGKEQDEQ